MRVRTYDLQVSDLGAVRDFFETFFGLHWMYERQNQIALFKRCRAWLSIMRVSIDYTHHFGRCGGAVMV